MTDPNLDAVLAMPRTAAAPFLPLLQAHQPVSDREVARENLRSRGVPVTDLAILEEMERIRHANDPERNR